MDESDPRSVSRSAMEKSRLAGHGSQIMGRSDSPASTGWVQSSFAVVRYGGGNRPFGVREALGLGLRSRSGKSVPLCRCAMSIIMRHAGTSLPYLYIAYGAAASISNWKNFSVPAGTVKVTVSPTTVGVSEGSGFQVIISVLEFRR